LDSPHLGEFPAHRAVPQHVQEVVEVVPFVLGARCKPLNHCSTAKGFTFDKVYSPHRGLMWWLRHDLYALAVECRNSASSVSRYRFTSVSIVIE
jgi:hypothetical protein